MAETFENQRLRKLILEDIQSTANGRSLLKRKIETRKKMVDGILPVKQYHGRANVVLPFPYTYVQSMLPRYMHATFPGRDIVEFISMNGDFNRAANQKKFVNHALLYEMDFYTEAFQFYTSLLESGAAVQKIRWNNERQCSELLFIRPDLFAFDIKSCAMFSAKKTRWAAYEMEKTKDEIKLGLADPLRNWDVEVTEKLMATEPETMDKNGLKVAKERSGYPMWEWWGMADPEDGKGPRRIIAWLWKDQLLGYMDSPYGNQLPFIVMSEIPDTIDWYKSKSELDAMESPFEAASDIINQRFDNVSQAINGKWTYLKNSGLDMASFVSSPWGLYGVNRHEDIKYWESPNVTQDAYREVGEMYNMMKLGSGLLDSVRGEKVAGEQTAQEFTSLQGEAGQRPGMKVQMAMYLYVSRIGQLVLEQAQMFMTTQKAVAIIGDPNAAMEVMSPMDIEGAALAQPMASALTGSKEQRAGVLVNAMNVFRGVPGMEDQMFAAAEEFSSLMNIKKKAVSEAEYAARKQAAMGNFEDTLKRSSAGTGNPKGIPSQAGQPPAGAPNQTPGPK